MEARTNLLIHGRHTYQAIVSDNALGTIGSVEHALADIPDLLTETEKPTCDAFSKQSEGLSKQLGSHLSTRQSCRPP